MQLCFLWPGHGQVAMGAVVDHSHGFLGHTRPIQPVLQKCKGAVLAMVANISVAPL